MSDDDRTIFVADATAAVHVHVLPDAPVFTDEDERRELQSLTIKEITDIEKDLRGITSDMNGLRLGSPAALGPNGEGGEEKVSERRKKRRGGEETVGPAPSEALRRTSLDDLSKLELEILQMSPDSKESYIEACLKCPDLLTLEHKTAFIEYSGFDTHKAAIRLCEYWKIRVATFGFDRAFLPMTLAGAMRDEVKGMIEYCPMQILPSPDLSGRSVLFFNPIRRNFQQFSEESEARSLFYLINCLCFTDESARKAGFVGIAIGRRVERKSLSFKLLKFNMHLIKDIMPICLRSCHVVYPSPALFYLIWPVVRYVIGKEQRLRWILHNSREEQLIHDLEGYRFHRARLPTDVGGDLEVDAHLWAADRSVKETFLTIVASAEKKNANDFFLKRKHSPEGIAQSPSTCSSMLDSETGRGDSSRSTTVDAKNNANGLARKVLHQLPSDELEDFFKTMEDEDKGNGGRGEGGDQIIMDRLPSEDGIDAFFHSDLK